MLALHRARIVCCCPILRIAGGVECSWLSLWRCVRWLWPCDCRAALVRGEGLALEPALFLCLCGLGVRLPLCRLGESRPLAAPVVVVRPLAFAARCNCASLLRGAGPVWSPPFVCPWLGTGSACAVVAGSPWLRPPVVVLRAVSACSPRCPSPCEGRVTFGVCGVPRTVASWPCALCALCRARACALHLRVWYAVFGGGRVPALDVRSACDGSSAVVDVCVFIVVSVCRLLGPFGAWASALACWPTSSRASPPCTVSAPRAARSVQFPFIRGCLYAFCVPHPLSFIIRTWRARPWATCVSVPALVFLPGWALTVVPCFPRPSARTHSWCGCSTVCYGRRNRLVEGLRVAPGRVSSAFAQPVFVLFWRGLEAPVFMVHGCAGPQGRVVALGVACSFSGFCLPRPRGCVRLHLPGS